MSLIVAGRCECLRCCRSVTTINVFKFMMGALGVLMFSVVRDLLVFVCHH